MNISFDWRPTKATLKWNGHEMELMGEFGMFNFDMEGDDDSR